MEYGNLFSRAWDLIWKHKFLILLGVLVVLGGAGGGGGGTQGLSGGGSDFDFRGTPQFDFNFQEPFRSLDLPVFAIGGALIILTLVVIVGLAFWVLGTLSRGGLIHGADQVSRGGASSFGDALQAGWSKGWRLMGISLIPAIPGLLLVITAFLSAGIYTSRTVILQGSEVFRSPRAGFLISMISVTCVLIFLSVVLSLLRTFANRACMLEDTGVLASYRRGLEVLGANLGPAIVLFALQIAISIGIGLVMLFSGIILIALCCFLWPLLLLIQGTFAAFYSTLWTLAWNQWTGVPEVIEEGQPSAA